MVRARTVRLRRDRRCSRVIPLLARPAVDDGCVTSPVELASELIGIPFWPVRRGTVHPGGRVVAHEPRCPAQLESRCAVPLPNHATCPTLAPSRIVMHEVAENGNTQSGVSGQNGTITCDMEHTAAHGLESRGSRANLNEMDHLHDIR